MSTRGLRLLGLAFFLPVPIVLLLFTRMPLGAVASLAAGVALMTTHRLYARPFALRHAPRRCLWCGAGADGPGLRLAEPFGVTEWRACDARHADALRRTFAWMHAHRARLRLGILGGLLVFLVAAVTLALRRVPPAEPADAVAFFRLSVALCVLPLGWWGARSPPSAVEPIPVPFPVHIQALVGTAAVLWLFRIVGLVWLGQALLHVARRTGFA